MSKERGRLPPWARKCCLAGLGLALSVPVAGQTPALGLDPHPRALAATDARATPNRLLPRAEAPSGRVDLSEFLPPVRSQGAIGSCAAWSTVYYARTILEQQEREWGNGIEQHQFSPLFTYNQITQGKNVGTAISAHMRILQELGGVTLADFPNVDRLDVLPDETMKGLAARYKISSFRNVPRRDEALDLEAVKSLLREGHPVVVGFALFSDFFEYRGGVYNTTSGPEVGGHALTIVGFDDEKGALRIVNSWGPQWGDQGFLWLSYDSALAMTKVNYGAAVMFDEVERPRSLEPPLELTVDKGVSGDSIGLVWQPSETAEGYTVLRADNTTREWAPMGTTTEPRYIDSNLPPGVTYVYSVIAQRGKGKTLVQSEPSSLAEGWTQALASVPGVVQGLDYLLYRDSVVLVWPKLADTLSYRIFRYQSATEEFVLLGSSEDAVYRDNTAFSSDVQETYLVVARNAQGDGPPSDNVQVFQTAPPDKVQTKLTPELQKRTNDDTKAAPSQRTAYQGAYSDSNWYDPRFVEKAFAEFAAKEKAAWAKWKQADADAFEDFFKNDRP